MGRNILGNRRSRGKEGVVPDAHWADDGAPRPNESAIADGGMELRGAIVVRCDGSSPDVHVSAHIDVAKIRQVGHSAFFPDCGVFDFIEIPDFDPVFDFCPSAAAEIGP